MSWNEWITIPVKYKDLPLDSQVAITLWDIYAPRKPIPIGGTTFMLFGRNYTIKRGKRKLFLWPNQEADGSIDSKTPSNVPGELTEMDRLEKLIRKYERGGLNEVEWLDKMVFREIEKIHQTETPKFKSMYLYVDLPKFDFQLVYNEKDFVLPLSSSVPYTVFSPPIGEIVQVFDPELHRNNPVEAKHRKLTRSHRNGPIDRNLKPNAKIRDDLNVVVYCVSQL